MATLFSFAGLRLLFFGGILTCITNFPSAFTHTSLNTAVVQMNTYLNESFSNRYGDLDRHEISLIKSGINNVWYLGQVFGAAVSPFICDHYGRKVANIVSIVMMTLACALQMAASLTPFAEILILGRVITAVFSPLSDAALILYLQEISPAPLRGTMSSLYATGYATMCMFGMFLGDDRILGHSLSALLFVPVIPGVLSTLFLSWIPDTPKFLMITKAAALRSLHFYQGKDADQGQLLSEGTSQKKTKEGNLWVRIKVTDKNPKTESTREEAFAEGVRTLVPSSSSNWIFHGFAVVECIKFVFRETAQVASSLLMVLLTTSCIVSTLIIDRIPRRVLLLSTGTICVLSLCAFVAVAELGYNYFAISTLFSFIFGYGMGVGPVAWFICPELVPLPLRSVMFCLCYAVHSCLVVVTNFATIPLFLRVGAVCLVPIFIVPMVIVLLVLTAFLPETKGKETEEIVSILQGTQVHPSQK